jgi:trigger factor
MKRSVRQRCGFGCILCGKPLYQYDHILGWANVKRHREEEILLLCAEHHDEKTKGLLLEADVREANENPFNLRSDVTVPYTLRFTGNDYRFDIGTIIFSGSLDTNGPFVQPIRIDGTPVLSVRLEDSHYLLTLYIADESGRIVMMIRENELVLSSWVWDVEFVARRIIIREGMGKVLVDIEFNLPEGFRIRRGRLLWNGIGLLVTEHWAAVLNNSALLADISIVGCAAGLVLGADRERIGAAFRMPGIRRRGWDRTEAIRWVKNTASESGLDNVDDIAGMSD